MPSPFDVVNFGSFDNFRLAAISADARSDDDLLSGPALLEIAYRTRNRTTINASAQPRKLRLSPSRQNECAIWVRRKLCNLRPPLNSLQLANCGIQTAVCNPRQIEV